MNTHNLLTSGPEPGQSANDAIAAYVLSAQQDSAWRKLLQHCRYEANAQAVHLHCSPDIARAIETQMHNIVEPEGIQLQIEIED